jgi:iron complex transport system substrate-binding protein
MPARITTRLAVSALLATTLLTGCGADGDTTTERPAAGSGFPRTVQVPGASAITVQSAPQRIAALSSDVAEAVTELTGGTQRLVAVPSSNLSPALSRHAASYRIVPNKVPPGGRVEPESVLSWRPDLVLLTERHEGEQDASRLLGRGGAPVIAIRNGWGTLDEIAGNLTLIGKALGADAKAAELTRTINTRSAAVQGKYASTTDEPSVLILSNQASRPFINDDGVITGDLVRRAGAVNAATALGVRQTMPVSTEHVIKADPDAILLVDVTGKGMGSYDPILRNPAVQNLDAVKNDRVRLFPAAETYGGGLGLLDGLDKIGAWLHP